MNRLASSQPLSRHKLTDTCSRELLEPPRYGPHTNEPSCPTYVRESERPRPPVSEGRTIVTVD